MPISRRSQVAWVASVAAVLLYTAACAAPAIDFGPPTGPGGPEDFGLHGVVRGVHALCGGPILAVFLGHPTADAEWLAGGLAWLSNPIGLLALVLLACRVPVPAAVAGTVATGLCACYLVVPVGRPLIGAYLWTASMAAIVLGAAAIRWVAKQKGRSDPPGRVRVLPPRRPIRADPPEPD